MALTVTIEGNAAADPILTARVRDPDHPKVIGVLVYEEVSDPPGWILASLTVVPPLDMRSAEHRDLSASYIQTLPLARWERAARAFVQGEIQRARGLDEARAQEVFARYAELSGASDKPVTARAARSMTRLDAVARRYRELVIAGDKGPGATIAREYGVKPTTARAWIFRARKAGLLGPAQGNTTGERMLSANKSKGEEE